MNTSHVKYAFEGLQVLTILLVAGFGMRLCIQISTGIEAAEEADTKWDPTYDEMYNPSKNEWTNDIEVNLDSLRASWDSPEMRANHIQPGEMMLMQDDDAGLSHCQLHYQVNRMLKWGKGDMMRTRSASKSISTGINGSVQVGSVSVGSSRQTCPSEASFTGDCSYLKNATWVTQPVGERFATTRYMEVAAALMAAWVIMKLISLDADLVDFAIAKIFGCCCKDVTSLKGLTKALMMPSIKPLQKKYPKVQMILSEVVKYFRFKIASNTMLWPLSTLGYNKTCPSHLFTRMPGLIMFYVLVVSASLDLIYMLFLYIITAKYPEKKDSTVLFLPFIVPFLCALAGVVVVLMKASFSIIFAFNFNFAASFELSAGLGIFQVLNLLLGLLELVALVVTIAKVVAGQGSGSDPEAKDQEAGAPQKLGASA